jgi:hypothetical protein
MKTLQQFIRENKIRITVEYADSNPNMAADDKWMQSATHYKCILKCGNRQMTVPFNQGVAISREPTAADILNCLASDASSIENAGSFEDWASEFGYSPDSRKAEKTYNICRKQAEQLSRLLGNTTAYETLLWNTERL